MHWGQIKRVSIKKRLTNVLADQRPATEAYLELSRTSKMEIYWENN